MRFGRGGDDVFSASAKNEASGTDIRGPKVAGVRGSTTFPSWKYLGLAIVIINRSKQT